MFELSPAQARRLVINRQGLHKSNVFGRGDSALLACIERLSYVQIDTISVIKRAHHHTFWTRIPNYRAKQLDLLQRDRKIFEYWAHAAAYLPMQDFRYCLPYMNAVAAGQKHWRKPDRKTMKAVLDRIRSEGPAKARDFDSTDNRPSDFWGGGKPARYALEQLFIEGRLMISHRDGFQKVFDLPERILPNDLKTCSPSTEEYCRYLIERTIQSQGIATEAEIGYLRKGIKPELKKQTRQMLADNEIVRVSVAGNPHDYYSMREIVETARSCRVAKQVHLLSPFDNLVIQRKRMAQLFGFDYQIECYVPQGKRVHGYFCLPILFGDQFVGRLDPKADRSNRKLQIRNLVIESSITEAEVFIRQLARKIKELAAFNGCETISIDRCNIDTIGRELSRRIVCED